MGNKKMVVIFPGKNYSVDSPLLYYAGFKFETRGYEKLDISYGDSINKGNCFAEYIEYVRNEVLLKLQGINLTEYNDVVFVSKSMGTVVAGWIEEKLGIEVRQIYLTPIKETLPYIKNGKNIIAVISGTQDKLMDSDLLKEHCLKENIYLKLIDRVGHRLEVWGDMNENIDILKEIVSIY